MILFCSSAKIKNKSQITKINTINIQKISTFHINYARLALSHRI